MEELPCEPSDKDELMEEPSDKPERACQHCADRVHVVAKANEWVEEEGK